MIKKGMFAFILTLSLTLATCGVYFTGVGCPHCAKTDPHVLGHIPFEYKNLTLIEYEIYQEKPNAQVLWYYSQEYGTQPGIPTIIFDKSHYIIGDLPILQGIDKMIGEVNQDRCPLLNGTADWRDLDINKLPGLPKIWRNGVVLVKLVNAKPLNSSLLKKALENPELTKGIELENVSLPLSGAYVNFRRAKYFDGWLVVWDKIDVGDARGTVVIDSIPKDILKVNGSNISNTDQFPVISKGITLGKITSLAFVDSINPCALAVLAIMLITITEYGDRRRLLYSGMAFVAAVYILYLIYGLVIVKFFQLVQLLTSVRLILYKALGVFAMLLGILNIKDFISYKPGTPLTEMPLSLRPKVKKILQKITSPKGAFLLGAFVTLFLLPCTIGPYIIAGGILSALEYLKTLPWLLYYNVIFVAPMVAIVLGVYFGSLQIQDVSEWRKRNITKLHLVAGILLFGIGMAMFMGWI